MTGPRVLITAICDRRKGGGHTLARIFYGDGGRLEVEIPRPTHAKRGRGGHGASTGRSAGQTRPQPFDELVQDLTEMTVTASCACGRDFDVHLIELRREGESGARKVVLRAID